VSHVRTPKGGRPLFGKKQAKADGKVTRRQEDRSAIKEQAPAK